MSEAELPEGMERRLQRLWADAGQRRGPMHGETVLASSLEVSRPAVREALVRLEERGFIHRRKGERLDSAELIAAMGRAGERCTSIVTAA